MSNDFKPVAVEGCTCGMPPYQAFIAEQLPEQASAGVYARGSVLPPALDGCTMVEFGCGTGRDAFVASKLVGPKGTVKAICVDPELLAVAEGLKDQVADLWGFSNVELALGSVDAFEGVADESADVIVANRVVNLAADKEALFAQMWNALKPGGELHLNCVFADRRLPAGFADEPLLNAEFLGGAMYIEDFRRMMDRMGCPDLRWMAMRRTEIENPEAAKLVGDAGFVTATVRIMKLPEYLEDICEVYGNYVTYKGGMVGMEEGFVLDDSHTYARGVRSSACGNPFAHIAHSRYGAYFTLEGDRDQHEGACCGGTISKHLDGGSCCGDSGCCGGDAAPAGDSCCGGSSSSCCGGDQVQELNGSGSSCCGGESAGASSCCGDSSGSSCCGDGPVNGCCDPEATVDDPNLERKETVIIDYLYLDQSVCDRCQGTDTRVFAAVDILRPIMDMAGYNLVVNRVEIENEYLAQRFEFASSPTVRVNGVDICPEIIENECDCCRTLSSYDVFCRQFDFNGKLYEVPPTAYVVKRILEIVFKGEKPSYEPFEMPENIRGFLREKYDQSTARAAE
ncbi:MAG: DUF2703 domain-containing protein [Coriobacteriia bacterium]|nr:DUF2703 domain-containing protein [Coriobacteriia bacterium]